MTDTQPVGFKYSLLLALIFAASAALFAQSEYKVVTVADGGTISGTVKWSGPVPKAPRFLVSKDPQICDPDSTKIVDLERIIVGPQGGLANTIVYIKEISSGKAMDLPPQRRHLDQGPAFLSRHARLAAAQPSDFSFGRSPGCAAQR